MRFLHFFFGAGAFLGLVGEEGELAEASGGRLRSLANISSAAFFFDACNRTLETYVNPTHENDHPTNSVLDWQNK